MPKSLQTQLEEALEAGDIEKAKGLAAKIKKAKKPSPVAVQQQPQTEGRDYRSVVMVPIAPPIEKNISAKMQKQLKADRTPRECEERAAAKKISVACEKCNKAFNVYRTQLTETIVIEGDREITKRIYICNRCLTTNR